MAKKQSNSASRPIATKYYEDVRATRLIRINRAAHANSAVVRAVDHMQLNSYGAILAEVHDERDGVLHALVKRSVNGDIHILYQREVKEGM